MRHALVSLVIPLAALPAAAQVGVGPASIAQHVHVPGCDPRTPIQDVPGNASWRHIVTEPGSYYLADNVLGAPNVAAIRIDVRGVTIDFNGFALLGTDPAALNAVFSSEDDVVLRGGGVIKGWSGGVNLQGARCRVEDLTIVDSLTNGLELAGPDGSVLRCDIGGHDLEGLRLGPGAGGTTVRGCKLRDNGNHQVLVESDGNLIEGCAVTADVGTGTQSALAVLGAANVLRDNRLVLGTLGEKAIEVGGDGNRLLESVVRLTDSAVFSHGIAVTGAYNEVRGGTVTVQSTDSTALRFDQPLSIIAILIGLQATADGSTGVLGNAGGTIEGSTLLVDAPDSTGVEFGGTGNVGATVSGTSIRVSGAGSTAVHSLASASIIQMSGIVLEAGATDAAAIDVLGGPGGHHFFENGMILAGINQDGGILNGTGDLFSGNDLLLLGDGCTAIQKVSGDRGMISDNRIRLAAPNATGIFVTDFTGELVTRNVVLGDGTQFDFGEGNTQAQILSNPSANFVTEDVVNLKVGN